jgi:pimeloyl-ACP methyl ester carboxylesterase
MESADSVGKTIDLGRVRMCVVDEGQGDAVVFLHGLASNLDTFAAQAAHLRDRYRCIRVDLRGHGCSSTPAGPWTISDFAEDLVALLARLGLARAHFVGHSAGGVIATRLVLDHPELVRSLCLVATAPECNEKAANEFYLTWAATAEREGMLAALKQMGFKRDADESKLGDPIGFALGCRAIATLFPQPLTPLLGAVRCPALILVGDKDFIGAGGSVKASRALAGSTLEILPGLGHLPFLQDPEGFNARLEKFLASQPA